MWAGFSPFIWIWFLFGVDKITACHCVCYYYLQGEDSCCINELLYAVIPIHHLSKPVESQISAFFKDVHIQKKSVTKGQTKILWFRLSNVDTWIWCHDTKTQQLFKTFQKISGCIWHLLQYSWIQESSRHRDVLCRSRLIDPFTF